MIRAARLFALALSLAVTAGAAPASADPLEAFNRSMFAFNGLVVDHVIEPLSGLLQAWVPPPVREAGARVYGNLTEPEFIVTNLFSGNRADAGVSAGRFAVNTTLGLGGLFDPATGMGLIRRETEFGESLCRLGVPTEPFLVLPLIGPTNVWSAGLLSGFFAVEWYALSLISTLLATADLVVDISASAASLRHAADQPDMAAHDPYVIQRTEYLDYIEKGCGAAKSKANQPVAAVN
ncbi:MAG: MlaA family lipoprotein [Rhodospirillaceae bacterium]